MRRAMCYGLLIVAMSAGSAVPAAAAPRSDLVTVDCGDDGEFEGELFSFGNPIRVVGTNQNFVVQSAAFVDPETGELVHVQQHPETRQELLSCSFDFSGRTFVVTGFFAGR